jgi:hypothetical protein
VVPARFSRVSSSSPSPPQNPTPNVHPLTPPTSGINSAVTNGDHSASSYAHRDKLYLIQFYDASFFGAYPADGFGFLDNWVSNVTTPLPKDDWGMYINYADPRLNRTAAGQNYYGASLPRLQNIKSIYDPAELFYYPQAVQPVAGQ